MTRFMLWKLSDGRIMVIADGGTIAQVIGETLLPVIAPRYWPEDITEADIMAAIAASAEKRKDGKQ